MQLSQLVERAADINGPGLATVHGERRQSWREVAGNIARLAGALRVRGLAPGERVAILSNNSDRFIEALFAIPWAGGIAVPLNTRLSLPEMLFQLTDSGVSMILIETEFADRWAALSADLPAFDAVIAMDDGPLAGATFYEACLGEGQSVAPADAGPEATAAILYTGGTTGRPKGVMVSERALIMNAYQSAMILGDTTDMIYAHVVPMFHIGDVAYVVATTLHAGTHVVLPSFDPGLLLDLLAREKVTHLAIVPTMINRLVNDPSLDSRDLSHLRRIIYGASPIPETLLRRAIEALPHVTFGQSYGQTESITITVLRAEHHALTGPRAGKLRTAGQPALGCEIRIVDGDDQEVPPGTLGEICVRSEALMSGYWNRPDATQDTMRGGFVHTGDIGLKDEDGFVSVVDRLKDMIITGGENVYSVEVEDAIHRHPAIAECAVIGIPHNDWGEQVHAIVRLKDGQSLEAGALIEHCRAHIAGYKVPRSVEFRTEPLPLSGAGKILKRELRDAYLAEEHPMRQTS